MPNTTIGAAPEGLPFDRLPDEAIANLPFDFRLLDIFVTNFLTSNTILTNVGEGGFDGVSLTGAARSQDVALGDLDGDGDLDAIVANLGTNRILTNQGGVQGGTEGEFDDGTDAPADPGDSVDEIGFTFSQAVALGDLDNDGDLDAFIANLGQGNVAADNQVLINQGGDQGGTQGTFLPGTTPPGDPQISHGVALGYLNDDEYLDAYIANNGTDQIFFNDGAGGFLAPAPVSDADGNSRDVAFGDLNGDGHLDIFVAVGGPDGGDPLRPNLVLLNDGLGNFTAAATPPGSGFSHAVALGDLDGDGDLDAFVANGSEVKNQVLLNNGDGTFTDITSDQLLFEDEQDTIDVSLGDFDGDGDLDAHIAVNGFDQILWNDGSGIFDMVTTSTDNSIGTGSAVGDLNGDGEYAAVNDDDLPNLGDGLPNLEMDLLLEA